MEAIPAAAARRRAIRVALRLGLVMLASGAQTREVETNLHRVLRWLGFAAPALLSIAVTILFGGSIGDAFATLAIGLAIQPALDRIERSGLPSFFRVVVGTSATALLVLGLVKLGLPIQGSLVLTGSLLRFLPGGALVSGMHDLIDGALASGTARLAEVVLLSAAIAGAASLILAFGASWDVQLQITSTGRADWPALVLVTAGFVAVAFYACRLGVPRRALGSAATLARSRCCSPGASHRSQRT